MLAPDGKKTKLAVADLRALVAQLPQMPEDERLRREKMQEHIKKAREKEKELRKSGAKLDTLALSKEEKEKARKVERRRLGIDRISEQYNRYKYGI